MSNCAPIAFYDFLGPLTGLEPAARGGCLTICPTDCTFHSIFDMRQNKCRVGALLGLVLGVEVVEGPDCPFEDDFIHAMVRAEVKWGLGNATFRAEVDFLNGTQIGIVADSLKVAAKYIVLTRPWIEHEEFPCLPKLKLSAGVGYGVRSHNSNSARLTELAQIESPGDTQLIPIPQFAISMTVLPVCTNDVSAKVFGYGKPYAVDLNVTAPLSNARQYNVENMLPLQNGARFVEITNKNSVGSAFAWVIFGLSL